MIDISQLTATDLAAILAHARKAESDEREARKAMRAQSRKFLGGFLRILATSSGIAEQTFKSGAQGWSLGGKDVEVTFADGTTRKARVSMLVRWEDTIPAGSDDDSANTPES